MRIDLNLTKYQNQVQIRRMPSGRVEIFDIVRRKYVVLQPEELVRQLVLHYLVFDRAYPLSKIRVEMGLNLNGLAKRCDILIFDKAIRPLVLVECKAATVELTEKTFEQIARYNMPLQVPCLVVTNGVSTFCCEMLFKNDPTDDTNSKDWVFKGEIPKCE
jgi:hypothetical protein